MEIKELFSPKVFPSNYYPNFLSTEGLDKIYAKDILSIKLSLSFSGRREGRAISLLNETGWLTNGTINYIEKGLSLCVVESQ